MARRACLQETMGYSYSTTLLESHDDDGVRPEICSDSSSDPTYANLIGLLSATDANQLPDLSEGCAYAPAIDQGSSRA